MKDLVREMFRQSTLRQSTCQSVPNTYQICMTAPLSFFLETLSGTDFEDTSLCDILTLGLFVETFTADDKYYLCNSEILP